MLPIGGMLTAIFILHKWGLKEYMNELRQGMNDMSVPDKLVKTFLMIAAAVVGFIIISEILEVVFGITLIQ